MSNKRLKITPQGWLVLAAIVILVAALVIILIVVGDCGGKENAGSNAPAAGETATPDPNATPEPTAEPTPEPTAEPTAEPSTEPLAKAVFTEPTADMIAYAVAGTTNVVGATLRAGPGTDFEAIQTRIAEGSTLTIYQDFGQWVFCQVDALQKFGYINRKFVTPAVGATMYMPTTDQPAGTFLGTVNANVLTLRSSASTTSEELNNYYSGQYVYIHYVDGEFYYVTCAGSGEKGYMKTSFVTTAEVIPVKPAE